LQKVDRACDVRVDDAANRGEILVEERVTEAAPGIRQQIVDGTPVRCGRDASTPSNVARSASTGVTVTLKARSLSAAAVISASSAAMRRSKPFSPHCFAR
jgi:hypothetical protein